MAEGNGIMVYSDDPDLTVEMLGKAREIADDLRCELTAVIIGHNVAEKADELAKYGAEKVVAIDDPSLERFQVDRYLSALHGLVTDKKLKIVMVGSTRNGKPLAAKLAMRLDAGCIPDCVKLTIADGKLVGERMTYGGNAMAKMTFKSDPQIVTVPARAFEKPPMKESKGQVEKVAVKFDEAKTETIDVKPSAASSVRIEDAQVIVSCGRGLEKKEDKALLDDLSNAMCGQVGCSRPLAEDRKWFTEWIGLSGHKVRPKLYVACGISGVIQHVAGIRDSRIIVAINKDPEAPINEVADYAINGNLYEILPALTQAIKKQLQK